MSRFSKVKLDSDGSDRSDSDDLSKVYLPASLLLPLLPHIDC